MLIKELRGVYHTNTLADNFCDYSAPYNIADMISEIADSYTSVYHSDIFDFMKNNLEWVEEAIQEFGWEGCESSLVKAGQLGEYLYNENQMYNHLESGLLNWALEELIERFEDDVPDSVLDSVVDEICENCNNYDDLEEIIDMIERIIEEWEECREEE